ncbi:ankyrin repeat-containing domain protein [Cunninghamella echinulata]|nr:ankyrin repeat-containing domain protein [Cunninghamella echinulata]
MTKPTPPSSSNDRRTSLRLKKSVSVSEKSVTIKKSDTNKSTASTRKIVPLAIHDFRHSYGTIYYKVLTETGKGNEHVWLTEKSINNSQLIKEFQDRLKRDFGFSVDKKGTTVYADEENNISKRPGRSSKLRAMIKLTTSETYGTAIQLDSSEDEEETQLQNKKRKRNQSTSTFTTSTTKKGSRSSNRGPSQLQLHLDAMQQRKTELEQWIKENDWQDTSSVDVTQCCLRCSISVYRQVIEENNETKLEELLKEVKTIPHWKQEERNIDENSILKFAILMGNPKIVKLLSQDSQFARIQLSKNLTTYGSNTGFIGRHTFGHAVRQVNESRGNRQGNSAFYRESFPDPYNLDYNAISNYREHIAVVHDNAINSDNVIECLLENHTRLPYIYHVVASGSYNLASKLMEGKMGTNGFNVLHHAVLTHNNNEELPTFTKIQILKKAGYCLNISPLLCSAIRTTSTYLKTLFERLDPAEKIETDELNRTVAHFAAVSTTPDCLEYLISQGVSFSQGDKFRLTPLVQAARFGRHQNIKPLIKHLSNNVMPCPEFADQTLLRNKRRPLHFAAHFGHEETCKELIDCGATVDAIETSIKATPLIVATMNGHLGCVKVLIEHGHAGLHLVDKYSRSCLHHACMNGHYHVAKYLLLQGLDPNGRDSSDNTPAHYATAFGYLGILKLLVEFGKADPASYNVWRSTPCSVANLKGHLSMVQYLLSLPDSSVNVDFPDEEGLTMLHHAVAEKVTNKKDIEQNLRRIQILMDKNANVNSVTVNGETVLHHLVRSTHYKKHLFERTHNSNTILDDEECIEYQLEMAKIILNAGADINALNTDNETPFAVAIQCHNYPMVALLIRHGAKYWSDSSKNGNTFFHSFLYGAAELDAVSLYHLETSQQAVSLVQYENYKSRFVKYIDDVWEAVENNPVPAEFSNDIKIDSVNKDGLPAVVYGVREAINLQKQFITKEKNLVKKSSNSNYHSRQRFGAPAIVVEETTGTDSKKSLRFVFKLNNFLLYFGKLINIFKADMSAVIKLPKDFLKNNPKAKRENYPPQTGYSVLHMAALSQHPPLLEFLLANGANVNQQVRLKNYIGKAAIEIGYFLRKDNPSLYLQGDQAIALERVNKLFDITMPSFDKDLYKSIGIYMKYGANPCLTENNGNSALMKASRQLDKKIVTLMCCNMIKENGIGQGLENRNGSDMTALLLAVNTYELKYKQEEKKEKIDMVTIEKLLSAGADMNAYCEKRDSAIMKILRLGYAPLVKILTQKSRYPIDHMARNEDLETPLIVAAKAKDPLVLNYYLEVFGRDITNNWPVGVLDGKGNGPLALASSNGNLSGVQKLISYGAKPNDTLCKKVPLIEALKHAHFNVAEALIKAGANVNACDPQDGTPALHYAVKSEKIPFVRLLLKNGASTNLVDNMGQTALHWAIESSKNQNNRSMRVERLLLDHGADINTKDAFGRSPIQVVFTGLNRIPLMNDTKELQKKIAKLVSEYNIEKKQKQEVEDFIMKYGCVSDEIDDWLKKTKESLIESKHKQQLAESKHENKDDIILSESDRMTLKKFINCQVEKNQDVAVADPVDMLKELIDIPSLEIDVPDMFGRTPFHYAAIAGSLSCMDMLLDSNKVDINSQDNDKNGALQLALLYKHSNIAVMVHKRGGIENPIQFSDGTKVSAIDYSLSNSFMNVSYLFLSNPNIVQESLHAALATGKFHFADIMLRSTDDFVLSQTIETKKQNLWHILASFKPFDAEMWNDYLHDFIERITKLNLKLFADSENYTPLHYAAKNGQEELMKHLLKLDPHPQTIFDNINHQSQIMLAVSSNNVNCVKLLLEAGLSLNQVQSYKQPSMLLNAVTNKNLDMVKLLLSNGVSLDDDSDYGRCNAVMTACVGNDLEMLQALVDAGANLNKPSTVKRFTKKGKEYYVVVAPIFIASQKDSSETLKILLNGSTKIEVYGPEDEDYENGQSALMYNILNGHCENVKLLLSKGADKNIKDSKTNRTAFYQVLFNVINRIIKREIFEVMFTQGTNPDVNIVDEETGMTPLEYAIAGHNIALVDQLLALDANPNVISCTKYSKPSGLYNDKVNALFHCVLHDDLEILKLICKSSQHDIDWNARDSNGCTIISRIVNINDGYGYQHTEALEFISKHLTKSQFKKLIEVPDKKGKRPCELAMLYNRKDLYDALVKFGAKPAKPIIEPNTNDDTMDIEMISLNTVEEDAEAERQLLQAAFEAKKKKKPVPTTEKNKIVIDPYSKLQKVGTIVFDNGEPYDIMIMKVEVYSNSYSSNMFYKLSVIYNKLLDLYVLWTRWGAMGDEGMHQKTPYLTKDEAVAEFKSIFKSKTGCTWEDRSNFVEKPGRYQLIKARDPTKDAILDNVDLQFTHNELQPTKLSKGLYDTMKLFCNFDTLITAYKDIHLGIPIGQIPSESVIEATTILNRLQEISKYLNDNRYPREAKEKKYQKELIHEALQASSRYYKLLPTKTENEKDGLQPIISEQNVNREIARLNDCRYINFTIDVVLAAKHRASEMNPFDYAHRALGCQLTELFPENREFSVISKYMTSTAKDKGYEIAHLFTVNRQQEHERFKPHEKDTNRKLLWHGSQLGNFMGILKQGLRSKPKSARESGSLFGNGIYFADMFCKSMDFASNLYGKKNPAYGLLLLCEVALGNECEMMYNNMYHFEREKEKNGYTSIKGLGKEGPNLANSIYDSNGVLIPMGPSVRLDIPKDLIGGYDNRTTYNEYIVQDDSRVKIRYMVLVRHNDYCFTCQNRFSQSQLKSLESNSFKNVSWGDLNEYEKEIAQLYLHSINKTPKEFFDERLPEFLAKQESYSKLHSWSLPMAIESSSKLCEKCSDCVITMMMIRNMQELKASKNNKMLNPIFNVKDCQKGLECRYQFKSTDHCKRYSHLPVDKVNEVENTETSNLSINGIEEDNSMDCDGQVSDEEDSDYNNEDQSDEDEDEDEYEDEERDNDDYFEKDDDNDSFVEFTLDDNVDEDDSDVEMSN